MHSSAGLHLDFLEPELGLLTSDAMALDGQKVQPCSTYTQLMFTIQLNPCNFVYVTECTRPVPLIVTATMPITSPATGNLTDSTLYKTSKLQQPARIDFHSAKTGGSDMYKTMTKSTVKLVSVRACSSSSLSSRIKAGCIC